MTGPLKIINMTHNLDANEPLKTVREDFDLYLNINGELPKEAFVSKRMLKKLAEQLGSTIPFRYRGCLFQRATLPDKSQVIEYIKYTDDEETK